MEKAGKIFRESLIQDIEENFKNNKNIFLFSYSAVSSSQMDGFRKDLKRVEAQIYVSKNRIAQLALKKIQQDALAEKISGQTAFVWSNSDPVMVSKALVKFAKACEGLRIQAGLLDGDLLRQEDVQRLADLPSREILLAQLLQTILSPVTRFAGILNGKSRDLLSILKQLSEKKGGS